MERLPPHVSPTGITHPTCSQQKHLFMNTKFIRIQGKGNVSQAPDRIRIFFSLIGKDGEFIKAVEKCNSACEAVRAAAKSCGIKPSELKTTHFNVGAETKYASGRYQRIGFESSHELMILLPINKALIGRFLSAVIGGKANPQVNLKFELADAEGLKQRVVADAVANAKRRAETIASAAGIKLGDILNIEYGSAEIRSSSRPFLLDPCGPSIRGDIAPVFEPQDLKAEDTVTVMWKIEP